VGGRGEERGHHKHQGDRDKQAQDHQDFQDTGPRKLEKQAACQSPGQMSCHQLQTLDSRSAARSSGTAR
jgi:hypothetical protein